MNPPPSTEQLLVQVLVRALDRRVALEMSRREEPAEMAAAHTELELAFVPVWHRVDRLELDFDSEGVHWNGAAVLRPEEATSPLLPTLVSSGIQSLVLEPGCESSELASLVEVIAARTSDADNDLVMLLFGADLEHVAYSLGGDGSPPHGSPGDGRGPSNPGTDVQRLEAEALRTAVRREASSADDRGVVRLDDFDSTLYFLDDREVEYLRAEVEKQYAHDHARSVLALLFDTLQDVESAAVRDEVVVVLRSFLPYLLGSGRFTALAYLNEELVRVLRATELSPDHRRTLQALRRSVSERGTLTQIFLRLDEGTLTVAPRSLGTLLKQLDKQALETVLVWAGQLGRPEAKHVMRQALDDHFRASPDALAPILRSSDRVAVRRALAVASRLRLPELVDGIGAAVEHPDAPTRKLAVEVLSSIGGTPGMRSVAGALRDPDAQVRKAVYQAFLARPYRSIAKTLRQVLEATDLETVDLSERKLLFSAYGATVGVEGVSELERLLSGRKVFGAKPSSETRACAVLALSRIDTPGARAALEEAVAYRDPLVRSAAAAAVRELTT